MLLTDRTPEEEAILDEKFSLAYEAKKLVLDALNQSIEENSLGVAGSILDKLTNIFENKEGKYDLISQQIAALAMLAIKNIRNPALI